MFDVFNVLVAIDQKFRGIKNKCRQDVSINCQSGDKVMVTSIAGRIRWLSFAVRIILHDNHSPGFPLAGLIDRFMTAHTDRPPAATGEFFLAGFDKKT